MKNFRPFAKEFTEEKFPLFEDYARKHKVKEPGSEEREKQETSWEFRQSRHMNRDLEKVMNPSLSESFEVQYKQMQKHVKKQRALIKQTDEIIYRRKLHTIERSIAIKAQQREERKKNIERYRELEANSRRTLPPVHPRKAVQTFYNVRRIHNPQTESRRRGGYNRNEDTSPIHPRQGSVASSLLMERIKDAQEEEEEEEEGNPNGTHPQTVFLTAIGSLSGRADVMGKENIARSCMDGIRGRNKKLSIMAENGGLCVRSIIDNVEKAKNMGTGVVNIQGFGYSDTPYAKMLQKEQEETKKTIALLKNPKMGDRGALRTMSQLGPRALLGERKASVPNQHFNTYMRISSELKKQESKRHGGPLLEQSLDNTFNFFENQFNQVTAYRKYQTTYPLGNTIYNN